MKHDITTMQQTEKAVQELIDSFADDIFIEALDEMISSATIAKEARQEETGDPEETGE